MNTNQPSDAEIELVSDELRRLCAEVYLKAGYSELGAHAERLIAIVRQLQGQRAFLGADLVEAGKLPREFILQYGNEEQKRAVQAIPMP